MPVRIYPKASPAGQKESSLTETALHFFGVWSVTNYQNPDSVSDFSVLHQAILPAKHRTQNTADLPQTGWGDEGQTHPLAFTFKVPVPRVSDE